ncbi:MAG: tetratricopeptide repeat protein [Candidatus Omnitrophota bacterium]|nr:tetratricopeptide repeat protein [Candidatus Omnitrophota bacterium]MDZ4243268.1 tetratricopeptide repeat protein [Candidatus Omnitrophota bacterium]
MNVVKGVLVFALLSGGLTLSAGPAAAAYNYGDYRSVTLVGKAWKALEENDLDAVLAYTNKCLELYEGQAKKMQASMTDYVEGTNDKIFAMWALNDVATALFIQGEAYRKAGKTDEAKAAYNRVVKEFTFGQCYDVGGWFWKPAEAAKEKISMIESGSTLDFGDYKSSTLATKAWEALKNQDLAGVEAYCNKCIELYADKAKEMQSSLSEYPWESKETIFSYWALNDVGACLFIKGEAYKNAGKNDEAKKAYKELVDGYFYSQCWDPGPDPANAPGWFWKPAEAAQMKLDELAEN